MTLFNEEQAAKVIGVLPGTLQAWRVRNQGPVYIKVGVLVKYDQADLEKFLTERKVRPGKRARRRKRAR